VEAGGCYIGRPFVSRRVLRGKAWDAEALQNLDAKQCWSFLKECVPTKMKERATLLRNKGTRPLKVMTRIRRSGKIDDPQGAGAPSY
jgi:hypothetical protein